MRVSFIAGLGPLVRAAGYPPLVGPKKEPWNQSVVRVIGPEGFLVSITYTPWMHEARSAEETESGG